jgi:glycosyltransferase involved in cell wall biosynthesis
VDTLRFKPSESRRKQIRERLGLGHATKIILAVGRLHWNKNFSTLIDAVAMLRMSDWLLLIVGQGSEEERLRDRVKTRGLSEHVKFLKSSSEMECIYAGADMFAHPALLEPYGNVVLEAMASGLPCIVSPGDHIGVSCELTDGANALTANPRDPQEWASKIARLLNDANLSANLSEEARRFCEDRPGWPILTSRLLEECGLPRFAAAARAASC